MDNIIQPDDSFDFSQLSLAIPTSIQGGAYFTKILYNNKPLYIQTSKSFTKQGIVKNGKKIFCDLMFDNNSELLINWFENLEAKCQKLIFEKSDSWFQNSLEINDVETAFNSIIRIYKSGKYYLVRTNIKNNSVTNIPIIKIYNENEIPLSIEDVKTDNNIVCILEIQGIKFTSRNFQIEIELKQVMVLNNEQIFENCLIKKNHNENTNKLEVESIKDLEKDIVEEIKNEMNIKQENKYLVINEEIQDLNTNNYSDNKNKDFDGENINSDDSIREENINFDLEIENLDNDENEFKELKDIDVNNNLEAMKLKKPNEVYYELYKEAREKAKQAKKATIIAYLEAKNIKNTYMLDELDYSDNDFDNEIDSVSESELEGI